MANTIKTAIAGFGNRGQTLLDDVLKKCGQIDIVGVCDLYEDRGQTAAQKLAQAGKRKPNVYLDYRRMLDEEKPDMLIITASWLDHIPMAIAAMERGARVVCEVGGAYSVEQCWDLVRTYERTGTPCSLIENCCYGREELMALNIARKGLFGKVVHCAGRYGHDLRYEVSHGKELRHYRLENYLNRNCENYPTHELGPIAMILDINYGNRMMTLTSTASLSASMEEYIATHKADDPTLVGKRFAQADIVTTVIKCARGETIELQLDTTLPRYYSRGLTVRGTRGMLTEDNRSLYLECEDHPKFEADWRPQYDNFERLREKYDHPLWTAFEKQAIQDAHGGMDWLAFTEYFDAVLNGRDFPLDVYDMAAWMSISALSEQSISLSGAPQAIPDFTCGKWMKRKPAFML